MLGLNRPAAGEAPQAEDYLNRDIQLRETTSPRSARRVALIAGVVLAGFLAWGAFASADLTARAPGQLLPTAGVQPIQAVDGGRIREVAVREGQAVRRGDLLVMLDDAEAQADLATNEARYWSLYARRERLAATAQGRAANFAAIPDAYRAVVLNEASAGRIDRAALDNEIKVVEAQLREVRNEVADQAEIAAIRKDLAGEQILARSTSLEADRALAQLRGQQAQLERQMASLRSDRQRTRADELSQVETELVQVAAQIPKFQDRVARARVVAPADGVVHDLKYRNAGAVVAPAAQVMTLVPAAPGIRAEVRIADRDVGGVKVGDPVRLRVNAFDYLVYGSLPGRLTYLAPNSVKGEDGNGYYLAFVDVDPSRGPRWARRRLPAGLQVEADITSERRSVLQLLLHPVLRAFDAARS